MCVGEGDINISVLSHSILLFGRESFADEDEAHELFMESFFFQIDFE